MKIRIFLISLILLIVASPAVYAQEYGKLRALQQRAAHVIKLKNDFVSRVLTSYAIPHERGAQGTVTRINVDGRWMEITAVEIVPVLRDTSNRQQQVAAHELFFYTPEGILDLVSALIIR